VNPSDYHPPFAVLDFRLDPHDRNPVFFRDIEELITATRIEDVRDCLNRVQCAVRNGFHAAGFISYEAAPALDPAMITRPRLEDLPYVWFALCRQPEAVEPGDLPTVDLGDARRQNSAGKYRFDPWTPVLSPSDYGHCFERVMQHLCAGDTYQINFTFPLRSRLSGCLTSLYRDIEQAQAGNYCAWLHGGGWDVISTSPELFFSIHDGTITARPMKGTRPRGRTTAADREVRADLHTSRKDRAENVMIVDMLRNDIGRIAELGTVTVSNVFTTEKYPTVWQMTSTVRATLKPATDLVDIMAAMFPCGSVTGAPKIKSMAIINGLEAWPRGVYCGAVGYLKPGGEAVFNVAIRTLTIRPGGEVEYPVGSGLVADSVSGGEYEECLVKARAVTTAWDPDFRLFETLAYRPGSGFLLLDRHLNRLQDSAEYFDFTCRTDAVTAALHAAAAEWTKPMRARLLLTREGTAEVEAAPLHERGFRTPRRVTLAGEPIDRDDVFHYHKTTRRVTYQRALAAGAGADDVILYNAAGEVTESTMANLAVTIDGCWVTPPVECGLLPGTMRAELLDTGVVSERVITVDELRTAEQLKLFNSVRGEYTAVLLPS